MKTIETIFMTGLFILASLCLILAFCQILTQGYNFISLITALIFLLPVLFALIFSGSLLIKNQNTK